MDIIRRNTDYAIRAMVHLACKWGQEPVSTKDISREEDISYQLACKLLQRLNKAKLVNSAMGPKGGFTLRRAPEKINLLEIIEAIQGTLRLNRCLIDLKACTRQPRCSVHRLLGDLQGQIGSFLKESTLAKLIEDSKPKKKKNKKKKSKAKRKGL